MLGAIQLILSAGPGRQTFLHVGVWRDASCAKDLLDATPLSLAVELLSVVDAAAEGALQCAFRECSELKDTLLEYVLENFSEHGMFILLR